MLQVSQYNTIALFITRKNGKCEGTVHPVTGHEGPRAGVEV